MNYFDHRISESRTSNLSIHPYTFILQRLLVYVRFYCIALYGTKAAVVLWKITRLKQPACRCNGIQIEKFRKVWQATQQRCRAKASDQHLTVSGNVHPFEERLLIMREDQDPNDLNRK
uniref:Uncharacterized protein n=1 Tax=Glossina austeni TaxID=7395 RepID=A0A1A9VFS0_GLOAU